MKALFLTLTVYLYVVYLYPVAQATLGPITLEAAEARRTLVIRSQSKSTPEAISSTLGRILPQVYAHLEMEGASPQSAPFARFLTYDEENTLIEGGFVVDGDVTGCAEIIESKLPASTVASVTHYGPYENLSQAYAVLEQWIENHGYEKTDTPWEFYLNDPEKVAPEAIETRISYPVRSRVDR